MKKLILGLLLTLGLSFGLNTMAADKPVDLTNISKIVSVDVQKVYQGYGLAKDSEEQIKRLEQKIQAERQKMVEDINKMGQQYNDLRKKLLDEDTPLKSDASDKLKRDVQDLERKIRDKEQTAERTFQDMVASFQEKRQQLVDARAAEVKSEVEKIAKILKVDHVLNSSGGMAVLYSRPELDITQKVIDSLNTSHPATLKK